MTSPMPFRIVQGLNGIRNPVKGIEGGGGEWGEDFVFVLIACIRLEMWFYS